jgi:endoglucanase
MNPTHFNRRIRRTFLTLGTILSVVFSGTVRAGGRTPELKLNQLEYFETHGLNVLLYHNVVHGVFFDQKLSGLEIILHGERIATNGDIRLLPTPEQWDPVPAFRGRKSDRKSNRLTANCSYPGKGLDYRINVSAEEKGFSVAVHLDKPLPDSLAGKAGFNLEFLPSAYFGKSYILDTGFGIFPRHPNGPMRRDSNGTVQPLPLASGRTITLAPEDPLRRVSIASETGDLMLLDGRNKAQNGWFVVRTMIPSNRTENAVVWHVRPNVVPDWIRPAVIGHNQVGYTPDRAKVAVLELDPRFKAPKKARVLRLTADGGIQEVFRGKTKSWGKWLRYAYAHFDFSAVREPGLYVIEYAGLRTAPFRIAADIYRNGLWQQSLDTYLPVQMDHMAVREGYRVWHGPSHLDDARQAPVNTTHFDGYAQGPTTDSPYAPGEHIPGLDRGGWYDAGDFDIRTQTQAEVVIDLAIAVECFGADWDETYVNQKARLVQIRKPDGIADAVQQVEHGALALLAQIKAFGHAIPGIIAPTLAQYAHLGDGASKTDNRIFTPEMGPLETDGFRSGTPDDRWAFTNRTTALDFLAVSSLAAASRVLGGVNDSLAAECLEAAALGWREAYRQKPSMFRSFNTTGGHPKDAEVRAAVELVIATAGGEVYRNRLADLLPDIQERFSGLGWIASRAIPFMDEDFKRDLGFTLRAYKSNLDAELAKNPYGVPVYTGTWGGSGGVAGLAVRMYFLHKAYPEIVGAEYTLRGLDYLLGTHPVSSDSYVSTVGTESRLVAYGNNRADYSFIPGGMIPGVVIVNPDFPELKADWPFLWFENEYVVSTVTLFILAANAADALTRENR